MDYYLTTNFTANEFACKCHCGVLAKMDHDFMAKLEAMRRLLRRSFKITSGFRCDDHNKNLKGNANSSHLNGMAADILCVTAEDRYRLVGAAIRAGFTGIGIDKRFIHVDNHLSSPRKIWIY